MQNLRNFDPENHGLIWNGKDLRLLNELVAKKMSIVAIAARLGRTTGACIQRLGIIRTAMVFYNGSDEDTIKTFKIEVEK